ncbi:hypothetical protein ACFVDI_14215 [Nocardioides sp. NPDC057767]|uniref:hypothetical protein n=1 Tax=unclassified Nocardioides TaxID=2615069 RepID=UPI0036719C0D
MTEGSGDTQGSHAKFNVFVRSYLDSDAVHRVRGFILESAASLEFGINEVLGAWLASNIETSDELAVNVLTRMPVRDRIAMLDRHMKETGADELWPLLVPVLQRIYDLRNRYSHGWVTRLGDGGIRIVTWNRGKGSAVEYDPDHLLWLAYEAEIASIDLARLWAFWVPADPVWHGDEAAE